MSYSGLGQQPPRTGLRCYSSSYVQRWKERFLKGRLCGLAARHKCCAPFCEGGATGGPHSGADTPVAWRLRHQPEQQTPGGGAWRQPHDSGQSLETPRPEAPRLKRHMISNDQDFEAKAADIIGLYLNAPAHAAVFCAGETSAIQALDPLDPVLPLSPGQAESHGFEY